MISRRTIIISVIGAAVVAGLAYTYLTRQINADTAGQRNYYVAPVSGSTSIGSASGDGSIKQPWDLNTALTNQNKIIKPGDTIWLRGGKYTNGSNAFTASTNLSGADGRYIIIRQFGRERATIEPGLIVAGSWTEWRDFEVANPSTDRGRGKRPYGIHSQSTDNRFINLIVHDAGTGIATFRPASRNLIYGSLIYNNGAVGHQENQEHGIYSANMIDDSRTISDNIIFNNMGSGIHVYGSDNERYPVYANGYTVEGNTVFNNGTWYGAENSRYNIIIGNHRPADRLKVKSNNLYSRFDNEVSRGLKLGYLNASDPNISATIEDNYIAGPTPWTVYWWKDITAKRNTIYTKNYGIDLLLPTGQLKPSYSQWDNNTYYVDTAEDKRRFNLNPNSMFFTDWQKTTGFDKSGTAISRPGARPEGAQATRVMIRNNKYETGRANITIYNWSRTPTVEVDIKDIGLTSGDKFEILDAQNFFGKPIIEGTYSTASSKLQLPMRLSDIQVPSGTFPTTPTHTNDEFNAFVIRKVSASQPSPSPLAAVSPIASPANTTPATPQTSPTAPPLTLSPFSAAFEAEQAIIASPMKSINDPSASDGKFIESTGRDQGAATITFSVPSTGNYYIWFKVRAKSNQNDSVYVSIDGKEPTDAANIYDVAEKKWSKDWQWSKLQKRVSLSPFQLTDRTVSLSKGIHTLIIKGRDINTQIDTLFITNDSKQVPTDTVSESTIEIKRTESLGFSSNGKLTKELIVRNTSSTNEAKSVVVTEKVPTGLRATEISHGGTIIEGTQIILWQLERLEPNQTTTLRTVLE